MSMLRFVTFLFFLALAGPNDKAPDNTCAKHPGLRGCVQGQFNSDLGSLKCLKNPGLRECQYPKKKSETSCANKYGADLVECEKENEDLKKSSPSESET